MGKHFTAIHGYYRISNSRHDLSFAKLLIYPYTKHDHLEENQHVEGF